MFTNLANELGHHREYKSGTDGERPHEVTSHSGPDVLKKKVPKKSTERLGEPALKSPNVCIFVLLFDGYPLVICNIL